MPVHVDERLLIFLPFYKMHLLREKPWLKRRLTDEIAREALLKAFEAYGHAKQVRRPDGKVWWESTDAYLKDIETNL